MTKPPPRKAPTKKKKAPTRKAIDLSFDVTDPNAFKGWSAARLRWEVAKMDEVLQKLHRQLAMLELRKRLLG